MSETLLKENELMTSPSIAETLANNLSQLKKKRGVTDVQIASATGIQYQTIYRLGKGMTPDPRVSTISLIANFFNVPISELLSGESASHKLFQTKRCVPVISWENAADRDFRENISLYNHESWEPLTHSRISNLAFAVTSTKSMQPRFLKGTTLIIEPKTRPADGDLVVVVFKVSKLLAVKEYVIDPPDIKLTSIIDNASQLVFNHDEHEIAGVIVESKVSRTSH